MVIYDTTNKLLYIPERDDIMIDKDELYAQAFQDGYADGYEQGIQECENNGTNG